MDRDPITNEPLPASAIQRVLYLAPQVHVYRIPPPSSPRYLTAALWTQNPADHIFTARLRLIETAIPSGDEEKVSATIVLEDSSSGELFAAAPYTHASVVEQATDSSRFFSVRVVGQGGMKATLGIGFEQRPEAFDFGVSLQDVRRVLDMDAGKGQQQQRGKKEEKEAVEAKRDLSLKEGEMITIKIGGRGRRSAGAGADSSSGGANPFAIAPPPKTGGGAVPFLPPPPGVATSTQENRTSPNPTAEDLGFDDGEFGEFQ